MEVGKWTVKNMYLVLLLSLFISILLEATILKLPLAFILLLCYSVLKRTEKVFLSAFFAGLLLDIFTLRSPGISSIFFLLFFAFVLLYQRKYEIKSYPFMLVSSFAGVYLYSIIFDLRSPFILAGTGTVIALAIFTLGKWLKNEHKK
jgi:cell shape-determining protein MreD